MAMDIERFMDKSGEQPLDTIAENGGFCGILGSIGCIGDSLSSGEFESIDYIIRHNTEDFTQIGFVGTPYHNADYKW